MAELPVAGGSQTRQGVEPAGAGTVRGRDRRAMPFGGRGVLPLAVVALILSAAQANQPAKAPVPGALPARPAFLGLRGDDKVAKEPEALNAELNELLEKVTSSKEGALNPALVDQVAGVLEKVAASTDASTAAPDTAAGEDGTQGSASEAAGAAPSLFGTKVADVLEKAAAAAGPAGANEAVGGKPERQGSGISSVKVGLGSASPTAKLPEVEASLLQETEEFLDVARQEWGVANATRTSQLIKKNRLLKMRCNSVLDLCDDAYTQKQIAAKIQELDAIYEGGATISHATMQEPLLVRSDSYPSVAVSDEGDDADEAEANKKLVPVTFEVRCDMTQEGEKVLIVGDPKELGAWNSLAGVEMNTDETCWPIWHASVYLPAGRIVEYKYAIGTKEGAWLNQYNVKEWEGHQGNRGFKVGRRRHMVQDEFMVPLRNPDPRPPSFVHMSRTGGQQQTDCFIDAEYCFIDY